MIDCSQRKLHVPILGRRLKSPLPSTKFPSPVTVVVEVHTDTISQTPQWKESDSPGLRYQPG